MKHIKVYEQFVNEAMQRPIGVKELVKLLKALPADATVQMPTMDGRTGLSAFHRNTTEAIKALKGFDPKGPDGDLNAKVYNVTLDSSVDASSRQKAMRDMMQGGVYNVNVMKEYMDLIRGISLAFDFETVDWETKRQGIRSAGSLD